MKLTVLTLASAVAIAGSAWSQDPDADNTGKNVRDRADESQTATDESNDPADIKMTAAFQKMVVADDSFSMMAKNVKIITVGGVVTLRGPVEVLHFIPFAAAITRVSFNAAYAHDVGRAAYMSYRRRFLTDRAA